LAPFGKVPEKYSAIWYIQTRYTWGESDVILPTLVNAAMLKVYYVSASVKCKPPWAYMFANCSVWNYTPIP